MTLLALVDWLHVVTSGTDAQLSHAAFCFFCMSCRHKVLLATSQLQRIAKGLEDAAAGRYKRQIDPSTATQQQQGSSAEAASSSAQVQAALAKAADRQSQLVAVLQQLRQQHPELQEQLEGVLAHAAAAETWLGSEGGAAAVVAH
jgi:hypothetical protein